jgi:hypothetical protein
MLSNYNGIIKHVLIEKHILIEIIVNTCLYSLLNRFIHIATQIHQCIVK